MHREYHPTPHSHSGPGHSRRWRWWLSLLPWVAVVYVATGFYSVQPNQRAVVRRCGRVLPERGPGLHFGFPYGIDRVTKIKVLESKRVGVGTELSERALARKIEPQQTEGLTGDRNLILIPAIVQYRISEPKRYLFNVEDVPALVRDVATSALSSVIASMSVDDVLTVERLAIQYKVKQATQEALDRYGAGVQVTSVSLEDVGPPQEQGVAKAFSDVSSAREDRQRTINEAQGNANRLIPQARGEAQRIRLEAEAYRNKVVQDARGESERFTKVAAELAGNRQLTSRRLILETMEAVLPRLRKIVIDDDGQQLDLGIVEEER